MNQRSCFRFVSGTAWLAFLLVIVNSAGADEPIRVRFAPELATAEARQRIDLYIEDADLRRAPGSRTDTRGPIVIEEPGGGRRRALLDGRFAQRMEIDAAGAASCGEADRGTIVQEAASQGASAVEAPVATFSRNPDRLQGADADGRILLYTPEPIQAGSSVSHWDRRATPNLLMEPALGFGGRAPRLDVTPAVMQDLGWRLGSSQVVIVPTDVPGVGLNDPRPFGGAPGNPAATLGAARRAVLEAAFATWAETLHSDIPIVAVVRFSELFCERNVGAILAGAGPLSAWSDLDAPEALADTWYPAALAESLEGRDLTGPFTPSGGGDITVIVNTFLDEGCLGPGTRWYYGLDNQAPETTIDLYAVLLHELAHGLGMLTFTDASSGAELAGSPAIYDRFLYDPAAGKTWPELDDEARGWSARRHGRLVWNGAHVREAAPGFLAAGSVELRVAGGPAAGEYPTVPATFGGQLGTPLTAPLACVQNSLNPTAPAADACSPLGGGSLAGRIALVETGGCANEVKARNVQQAGGIGMILVNLANETQLLAGATGEAGDIAIPILAVGRSGGARLEMAACPSQAPPLAGGRFDVRAIWFTDEASGIAQMTRLTADSVYATFFGNDNPELIVKVLNACTAADPRFWVFAAGLTNVGVQLVVTDTVTGLTRGYANPPGRAFEPRFDTSAFACTEVP